MRSHTVHGTIEGGKKLNKYLRTLALRLGDGGEASIGFLEGKTYPEDDGGQNVAQVAFWNEYGTSRAPSRPFFRNMIEDQSPTWARKLGMAARYSEYRVKPTLEIVAADIKGHLVESILLLMDPPNAPSTIARKKFKNAKPLVDTSVMLKSPAWVVKTGTPSK